MATTNGTTTPPAAHSSTTTRDDIIDTAQTDTSANKRKREDEKDASEDTTSARNKQTQQDILELLRQHDTTLAFLDHDLIQCASGLQPSPKKARVAENGSRSTIAAKLAAGTYSALASLTADASAVARDVENKLRDRGQDGDNKDGARLAVEDLKQIQRAKAFNQLVAEIVEQELHHSILSRPVKKEADSIVNGYTAPAHGSITAGATVLTLFGNAPTPKQLFSSMQTVPGASHRTVMTSELPVEEMSLPNGLTATRIAPAPADDGRKAPCFEDSFAPPYSSATLNAPKVTKRSSTRDNTAIYWEFKDAYHRGSRKGGYTVQSTTNGDWLGYGGVSSSDGELTRQKRKQRDRALSNGAESTKDLLNLTSPEEQQARAEEALFRRAYSSFAPSHDNARAVVPAEIRSMLWWHKVGEQRYRDTFAIDPALLDGTDPTSAEAPANTAGGQWESGDFEEVMDKMNDFGVDMDDVQQVTSKTEVDHVLLQISDLLETLASHQRIRNATLATSTSSSRTPISPAPVLASRIGKPDEPAEDELATYQSLRRELVYLVLKLPPYAVAKLDGDQLAELGVSTIIRVKTKNVRGTMEEDQVARLAKYNAAATAAGIATLTRTNSSTAGQHYNTTAQRTPAIGQAAQTRYAQTPQYTSSRTPAPTATQFQRPTQGPGQYGTPGVPAAPSATPRSTYSTQPNQYTRPGAPQQHSYNQTNGTQQQYYQSRPPNPQAASNYYGASQYANTALAQHQKSGYPTQQPTQHHTRPSAATSGSTALAAFQNSAKQVVRTSSPANVQPRPVYPAQSQYPHQQQQQPHSGRGTPTYSSQPQTPVNGYQRPPPPPPPPQQQQVMGARTPSGTPGPNRMM
ncbi:hypothetical protein LTR62_002302 [Meristemomyces frigidus]|uniref:Uncharacterized protein n=1 Tax=Meristemomyces frigidus TaxID=1508187 RepID=A0AAN7TG83_9PEZI|nr:hypothetical protein LTR62_002302 [Meristemomyces frigidus]